MATITKTRGEELTSTLRRILSVGTRTRRYRNRLDLHEAMLEAIENATVYPGYYTGDTNDALQGAWAVYSAYQKHVGGYRIDGTLRRHITELSPYQFAAFLGRMVDAGVTNNGEGERFFQEMAREVRA